MIQVFSLLAHIKVCFLHKNLVLEDVVNEVVAKRSAALFLLQDCGNADNVQFQVRPSCGFGV